MSLEVITNYVPVVWDKVADCFKRDDLHIEEYAPAQENLEEIWPILEDVIHEQLNWKEEKNYRACDFGCGTGSFARKLFERNFSTFACDISKEMIAHAKSLTKENIVFGIGGLDFAYQYKPYQLIVAIMVFQFIDNLDMVIGKLAECLDDEGILFFAVHDMEYVQECTKLGVKFRETAEKDCLNSREILIDTTWIKTYLRSSIDYDKILSSNGLDYEGHILTGKKAPIEIKECNNWNKSKYYIAWYKKNKNARRSKR